MLGQDQLDVGTARLAYARGIGMDHHAFADHIVAGGHQLAFPLDLNTAHAARGDFVEILQITQVGDLDPGRGGGLHDGCAFGHRDRHIVDHYIYHLEDRPPLKIP